MRPVGDEGGGAERAKRGANGDAPHEPAHAEGTRDPRLEAVVTAWPDLDLAVRAAIARMIGG